MAKKYKAPDLGGNPGNNPSENPELGDSGTDGGPPGLPDKEGKDVAGDIARTLTETHPEPTGASAQAAPPVDSEPRDRHGRTFDSKYHARGPDGRPLLNRDGFLRARGGRPSKVGGMAGAPAAPGSNVTSPEVIGAAKTATACVVMLGLAVGGEEFRPKVIDPESGTTEEAIMERGFLDYFKAKGITDVPPGVALALGIGMYALPRLVNPGPVTRERLGGFAKWLGGKVKGFFGWLLGKRRPALPSAPPEDSPGEGGPLPDSPVPTGPSVN